MFELLYKINLKWPYQNAEMIQWFRCQFSVAYRWTGLSYPFRFWFATVVWLVLPSFSISSDNWSDAEHIQCCRTVVSLKILKICHYRKRFLAVRNRRGNRGDKSCGVRYLVTRRFWPHFVGWWRFYFFQLKGAFKNFKKLILNWILKPTSVTAFTEWQ